MHGKVFSGSVLGVDGFTIEVEVDISRGIPCLSIVGLPNTAVRESRERVAAAIKNSAFEFPLERITVNLAPADIRKEGAAFDLPIALGILICSGQIPVGEAPGTFFHKTIVLGELALDGGLRRVRGVLPILLHAVREGFERAVVPASNFEETLVVEDMEVAACESLVDVVELALGGRRGAGARGEIKIKSSGEVRKPYVGAAESFSVPDMGDVLGQESAKRALVVAAAGGHHVLLVGPPGGGKTMLARRFPGLLPALSKEAAIETTMIYSTAGLLDGKGLVTQPPFRSPHHSASDAGIIGGGNVPRPGEVTLAHNGVLFLDELAEFKRHVLETLREPLEEGSITISRAHQAVTFPARFQLIAAMNPCPCGYLGSRDHQCRCSPLQIERYLGKISGPLLDRISIHCFLRPVEIEAFRNRSIRSGRYSTGAMREMVERARALQRERYRPLDPTLFNGIAPESIIEESGVNPDAVELLFKAQKQLRISARGRSQIMRVARTVADLEGSQRVASHHMAEAIQYRIRSVTA